MGLWPVAKLGWAGRESEGALAVFKARAGGGGKGYSQWLGLAGSAWVEDSAEVSGRVRLGVKWGCGQWQAVGSARPVSSLGLISSFLFGEWGKGI